MRGRAIRRTVLLALTALMLLFPRGAAPAAADLEWHASGDRAVAKLRSLDVGARKLSVDLLSGDIAEVATWR